MASCSNPEEVQQKIRNWSNEAASAKFLLKSPAGFYSLAFAMLQIQLGIQSPACKAIGWQEFGKYGLLQNWGCSFFTYFITLQIRYREFIIRYRELSPFKNQLSRTSKELFRNYREFFYRYREFLWWAFTFQLLINHSFPSSSLRAKTSIRRISYSI